MTSPAGSTEDLTYVVRIKRVGSSTVLAQSSGTIKASTDYQINVRMKWRGGTKAHPRIYRLCIRAHDASGNYTTLWVERFGIYN